MREDEDFSNDRHVENEVVTEDIYCLPTISRCGKRGKPILERILLKDYISSQNR